MIAGCALLLLAYLAALRFRFPARALSFSAGVAVLLLALVSPIDTLGDAYLFSAHMVQHILLILVVPPLLFIGIPRELADRFLMPIRSPEPNVFEQTSARMDSGHWNHVDLALASALQRDSFAGSNPYCGASDVLDHRHDFLVAGA